MIYLILITIIIIYIFLKLNNNNKIYIKSPNGILLLHKDSDKKTKMILFEKVIDNMYYLKNHLILNINNLKEYNIYIKLLEKNFNKNRTYIYETDPKSIYTSYSINCQKVWAKKGYRTNY